MSNLPNEIEIKNCVWNLVDSNVYNTEDESKIVRRIAFDFASSDEVYQKLIKLIVKSDKDKLFNLKIKEQTHE